MNAVFDRGPHVSNNFDTSEVSKGWCEDCDEYVELIETDVPLYAEI